jgi:hypothetical protein
VRVDNAELSGQPEQSDSTYTSGIDLIEGVHTLFVQERDTAGNWSDPTSRAITLSSKSRIGAWGLGIEYSTYLQLTSGRDGSIFVMANEYNKGFATSVVEWKPEGWKYVGGTGLPSGSGGRAITVGLDNRPIVAFMGDDGYTSVVMRFNGNTWDSLGPPRSLGSGALGGSLAVNKIGEIYFASCGLPAGKATVHRYIAGFWQQIGSKWVSDSAITEPSLAIDSSGVPYLAYSNASVDWRATVKYRTGASWVTLGAQGISIGRAASIRLQFGKNGVPYISFSDEGAQDRVRVLAYLNGSWQPIGGEVASDEWGYNSSFSLDENDRPIISYIDSDGKLQVQTFRDNSWRKYSRIVPTSGMAARLSMIVNHASVPIVGYLDGSGTGAVVVEKTSFDP